MNTKKFFSLLIVWILGSALHIFGWVLFLKHLSSILLVVGLILIVLNMAVLLKYFTQSVQLALAYRLSHKHRKDGYVIASVIIGIIINPIIIYLFFLFLFGAISQLVTS